MALRTHAFSAMRSRRRSRSRERERETERENERENVGGAGETTSHVAENPHGAKIQNVADQVAEQSSGNTVGEAGLRGGEDGDRVLVDVDGSSGAVDVGARKLDNTMTSTSASGISVAGLAEAPAMPLSATLPNRSISKISVGRRQSVSSMLAKSVKFGADTSISHDTGTLNRPGLHKWTSLRSKVGALSSFASTTALPIPSRTLSEMDANLEAWQESDHEETADKTTEDNDPSFPSLPSLPPDQLPGHEPGGPIIPSEEHDFGIASATLDGNAIRINRIPGAGPGLDASKWSHSLRAQLSVSSTVRIVDYSADRIRSLPVITTTEELEEAVKQRPEWAATRWICVDGISLDVIGVLANEFGLHPLAVEDVFHFPQRVKVDFYENFTFVSVHLIGFSSQLFPPPPDSSPMESKQPWFNPFSWSRTSLDLSDTGSTQIYMILTPPPSNTLILITQHTSRPLAAPIVARLRDSSTLIRTSADPSFLLYALLDCIVDHSVLLIRSYQARMAELEAAVFQKARSGYTRDLQFLRGEIQGIRIAVAPLRGVVAQLRMTRQGVKVGTPTAGEEEEEGVDGLWKSSEGMQTEGELGIGAAEKTGLGFAFALTAGTFGTDSLFAAAGAAQMLGPDLVSPLSKLFFGDVLDHISTVLDVVDMLERSAGDLIDLIFNTIATQTNDNMRILAIVSIIFLPCTFLTGFYGMNIPPEAFPELEVAGGTRTVWIILAATTMLTLLVFWMMGMLECECCYASGEMMRRRKRAKAMERGWR